MHSFLLSLFRPSVDWVRPTTPILGRAIRFPRSADLNVNLIPKDTPTSCLTTYLGAHGPVQLTHEMSRHSDCLPRGLSFPTALVVKVSEPGSGVLVAEPCLSFGLPASSQHLPASLVRGMGGVGSALEAESQPGCFIFPSLKEGHKDTKGILLEHNGLHSGGSVIEQSGVSRLVV